MNSNFLRRHHPMITGIFSAIIVGIIMYSLGNISGSEARILIKESLGNFGMLFNTITLGSATILALLLTALSTSRDADVELDRQHYQEIKKLTTLVATAFITAMFSFLLLLVPITEKDSISTGFYAVVYWAMLIDSSILVGMTITIGLTLRRIIVNLVTSTALREE